jgi:phosphomannomutase
MDLPKDLMVSVSGVRGRVGEALTPEVVTHVAAAFGAWAREAAAHAGASLVVARDSRPSGDMFVRAVTSALQSVGCDVVDLGMVPTPTALLAITHHRAAGGIIVTASHNPGEWNALKLASSEGLFLDAGQGTAMRAFLSERPIPRATWDATGSVTADTDAVIRHIAAILRIPYLDVEALRRRRFRVAIDAVHGAGGVLLVPLLEALGCEVRGIGMEPDGRFSREPEPVASNLGELERLVEATGSDIGLGLDPDGDRLSLVSDRGEAIGEDLTLALASALVLRHRQGPVVTNFSTSRVVEDVAEEAGVPVVRAPVGEINVARRMQAESAVVGGEGNGGVILPDVHLTRDAGVATALVLQLLVETGMGVHEHTARQRRYCIVKEKVARDATPMERVYRTLEARLGAPRSDRQDGLWLSWPEHRKWLHVRPSGTEPVIRMIAEALSEPAARELVELSRLAMAEPK